MKHFFKGNAIALCAALTLAFSASSTWGAEDYPSKPITIIFPYAAGSASDALARTVGELISKEVKQPVIVDVKPGAGASIGTEQVVKAAPDGYTLLITGSGSIAINPYVYKLRYSTLDDLVPITTLVEIPFVVVVNNDFPVKNLKEFIAYGKAKPGEIAFGNTGTGTLAHLTQAMFLKAAGMSANVVSYKGGGAATIDLLGGHVNALMDNAATQLPNIEAKKVRPLFVTTQERTPTLPQVPTASEAGLGGFTASGWFGLAAPKGTPPHIIDRLNKAIAKGFAQPDVRQRLLNAGWLPIVNTPSEAAARARADYVRFGPVVADLNLKPN